VPRNQPHAGTVPPRQNAETVMPDFVQPAGTGRRRLRWRWQTRLDCPRAGTLAQRHACLLGVGNPRVESRRHSNVARPSSGLGGYRGDGPGPGATGR
jgi:hypothetical protein